jgi:hypothetical protein
MRRKTRTKPDPADADTSEAETSRAQTSKDHDEFWSNAPVGVDEHLETLAGVESDLDDGEISEDTLEYMGSVPSTRADQAELIALAKWAESKACRACRKRMHDTHDPATLKHVNCQSALRVERLLRRYD